MTRHTHAIMVCIASVVLTYGFVQAIHTAMPDQPALPWAEIVATATGLACVWLTRLEESWCWPIGIVSSLLIAWTFFGYDLPGQAWLNLVYFTPVQFVGWWLWVRRDRVTGRPLVWVSSIGEIRAGVLAFAAVAAAVSLASALWAIYGGDLWQRLWDGSIVVASIVAQWLLNRKRVEAWWWWLIPVNVSSVILFWHQGAYLYSLMYVVFGIHAAIAIQSWRKSCQPA